jgi:hypothetical protein
MDHVYIGIVRMIVGPRRADFFLIIDMNLVWLIDRGHFTLL